jgi:hypothetical protein
VIQAVKFTFSPHVRRRAAGVIKIAPFDHTHTIVLRAIANIDWHQENDLDSISDKSARQLIATTKKYQAELEAAGVSSDETAIAYLNWVESKIRSWMIEYEELAAIKEAELQVLVSSFE